MDFSLQSLRQEVKQMRKKEPRVIARLLALIELTKYRQKHGKARETDFERISAGLEISARTLYRWEAAYSKAGVSGLVPGKQTGRKPHATIRGHTAKKIQEFRKLFNWGAEVIQAHLKHDHQVHLSLHKINRFLRVKGLLFRKKCKKKKRHTKIVQVDHPGHHTQIDVKHLPHILGNGKKCYNYNFVDHASKWSYKKAYDSYGPSETKDFMQGLVNAAPFDIIRAQTDNGIENTNKYVSHMDNPKVHALDTFCASHGIRHVLIPPGEKELQGLVERSHRQDDEELFHRINPYDLAELNKILSQHSVWRNSKRRRKAIDWKTSMEFLADYRKKIDNWIYENGPSPFQIQPNSESTDECVTSDKKAA
jgi:transposase